MPLPETTDIKPLVSIIITSYNRAHTIRKAIESALNQQYGNLEIVISDNNSTDNTDEVIASYLSDPRIKYFKNTENIGMIPNFKKATNELATGEYVVYVSSDDYLVDPLFIKEAIDIAQSADNIRVVFGRVVVHNIHSDEKQLNKHSILWSKKIWNGFDVFKIFPDNGFLSFGACMMKRKDLVDLDIFSTTRLNIDVECILKIMILGDVGFVDRTGYVFVRHGENESGSMTSQSHLSKLDYIEDVCGFARPRLDPENYPDLDVWENQVLDHSIKTSLYFLRLHEPTEYKKFLASVKKEYPGNLKRISKDMSWYLKTKLNRRFVLFVYRVLKPAYYHQEFANQKMERQA